MQFSFIICSMIFSITLAFSAAAQEPQETSQKLVRPSPDAQKAPEKRAAIPGPGDDEQAQKILNTMAARAGWFPDVKIEVENGLVTLKGRAKNSEQLQWLSKTADRIPTVVAVINQVELESPPATDLTPAWKEFKRLLEKAKTALPLIALALLLFAIFWFTGGLISRGVRTLWGRHISNPFLLATVSRLTMLPVWLLFFYLILQTAGLSALATTIIGGTGAVGIVIGFAFKDIAENYLSGLLLAMRSPFTKGDEISIDKFEGYVQALNMRGTTIIDYEGNIILIPNRIVIQSVIKNKTSSPKTRSSFSVGIGYNDSVSKAQETIYGALKKIPAILDDPAPLVVATELTASTVNLKVMFWYDCVKSSLYRTKSEAIALSKESLLAKGISIPDEAREIILAEPLQVRMLESKEEVVSARQDRSEAGKAKAREHLEAPPKTDQGGHERDVERVTAGTQIFKKMDQSN